MLIRLNADELQIASLVGAMRRTFAIEKHVRGVNGPPQKDLWEKDIVSAQAELAVAKATNMYWNPAVGKFNERDVGGLLEVRSKRAPDMPLTITPRDDDDACYLSVYCESPYFTITGWLWGREGKEVPKKQKADGSGAMLHFCPQMMLHPYEELRGAIAAHRRMKRLEAELKQEEGTA